MPRQEEAENRPIRSVRHRALKAAIWQNPTDKGMMYKVTITRSYRDTQSGKWRDTQSFGYDDLANIAALMYEAHSYISNLKAQETATAVPKPQPAGKRRPSPRPPQS